MASLKSIPSVRNLHRPTTFWPSLLRIVDSLIGHINQVCMAVSHEQLCPFTMKTC